MYFLTYFLPFNPQGSITTHRGRIIAALVNIAFAALAACVISSAIASGFVHGLTN